MTANSSLLPLFVSNRYRAFWFFGFREFLVPYSLLLMNFNRAHHTVLLTLALCLVPNIRYTCILLNVNQKCIGCIHSRCLVCRCCSVFFPKNCVCVDYSNSRHLLCDGAYIWYGAIDEHVYISICSIFWVQIGIYFVAFRKHKSLYIIRGNMRTMCD